jgi:tetraacyldisaccharide 4'-kinase
VGNLTTGGTGKTPLVIWLCRYLREKQIRCAVLTRGYRATNQRSRVKNQKCSDEPALLAAQCPGTAVVVNPDRVAGAAEAICRHDAQVLVMDDGFQHRRLARDLDLVAIDATRPFGYGKLLPAGLLREPVAGLGRAHAVVLTRCDQVSEATLQRIEVDIRGINSNLVIARSIHSPVRVETYDGTQIGLGQLRQQRLFAFCGIGNPRSFLQTVEHLGGKVAGSLLYDDHHAYTIDDLRRIRRKAVAKRTSLILTTQKDWTKISPWAGLSTGAPDAPPLAYLAVELQMTAGAERLTALIDRVVGSIMPNR